MFLCSKDYFYNLSYNISYYQKANVKKTRNYHIDNNSYSDDCNCL